MVGLHTFTSYVRPDNHKDPESKFEALQVESHLKIGTTHSINGGARAWAKLHEPYKMVWLPLPFKLWYNHAFISFIKPKYILFVHLYIIIFVSSHFFSISYNNFAMKSTEKKNLQAPSISSMAAFLCSSAVLIAREFYVVYYWSSKLFNNLMISSQLDKNI